MGKYNIINDSETVVIPRFTRHKTACQNTPANSLMPKYAEASSDAPAIDWTVQEHSNNFKIHKKRLWPEEVAKFKDMGEPDPSQNFLELFSQELISDLFSIMEYGSDNFDKANIILDELKPFGFYEIGEGTNILVIANRRYPGVVFKIALDHNGIADNFNDELLQRVIPRYNRVYTRHSTGIVSVQEYVVTMTKERIKEFIPEIISLLDILSKRYLIADLSPSRFLNFGINRRGEFVILDGSDLFPLEQLRKKFRCDHPVGWDSEKRTMKRCGGKLEYSADFLVLRCKKCGHEINPLELRPKQKEVDASMANLLFDGTSEEQRKRYEIDELRSICGDRDVSDDHISEEIPEVLETAEITEESAMDEEDVISFAEFIESDQDDDELVSEGTEDDANISDTDDETEPDEYTSASDEDDDVAVIEKPLTPAIPNDSDQLIQGIAEKLQKVQSAKMAMVEESDEPHIDIKVTPDGDESGIYLTVHGDFKEAWANSGMSIYVSLDNGETFDNAISFSILESLLGKVIEAITAFDDDK